MPVRQMIEIDENKCNGCGDCIVGCPEGALQLIDGKARLVSDLFCDGLGACIGTCPVGAITVIEREAVEYDEKLTMENIIPKGENTIKAHLKHLKEHGQVEYYKQALEVLQEKGIKIDMAEKQSSGGHSHSGCPGSKAMTFNREESSTEEGKRSSQLNHWPVQFHLISPMAPHFKNSDLLLAADCTAFTVGDFHKDFLKGKTLAIACPKLDHNQEVYKEKLISLIDDAKINTLTVMIMQVPCCGGLLHMAQLAASQASRKIPVKLIVVSIEGSVLREEWI